MKYNIGFTLGDPGGDGHACTTDYHIVANHSADEISKAYKETTKLLGFDFIKEVGVDFQSDYWIPEKFTKELLKLGIIDGKYVRELDAEWGAPAGCYEFDYAEEEFVNLYFAIVKSFAEQLAEVKNIFRTSYDQAIALNAAIAEDIKVKQNEIASIQTQIEFNQQVAEDNSKYISKLKDLIS